MIVSDFGDSYPLVGHSPNTSRLLQGICERDMSLSQMPAARPKISKHIEGDQTIRPKAYPDYA